MLKLMRATLFPFALALSSLVAGCSNGESRASSSDAGSRPAPPSATDGAGGTGGVPVAPGTTAQPPAPGSDGSGGTSPALDGGEPTPHQEDSGLVDLVDAGLGSGGLDAAAVHDASATLDASADADAPIVPQRITVLPLAGGNGVLEVTALTLQQGSAAPEIYVALKNTGDEYACSASVSVELYDWSEASLASGIGGLLTQNYYRLVLDGSASVAACIGPGEVSVAEITDLPADFAVEDVGFIVYRCSYFAFDVEGPLDALAVNDVMALPKGGGVVYTGEVYNGFDFAVGSPSVAVFPVNQVGRPLGVAKSTGATEIAPGGSWSFETNVVGVAGAGTLSFVAGAFGD